ncbi:MAG TPA: hypothetical protein DDY43_13595 [Synechococcales bacterium UBA10510]|nr:hypothetical protein [Synechococcales bacterium UBA10510]
MRKDETSRSDELKTLGWSAEEVRRYEELWEYRHRWGAINLERDDRIFLRRAEAALPKQLSGKAALRKTLKEKTHYRWLSAFHQAMAGVEGLEADELAAWAIVIEEELRALDYYQPVLGLPDTLKAKAFAPLREQLVAEVADQGRNLSFDFAAALAEFRAQGNKGWKSLRQDDTDSNFPVLPRAVADGFRAKARAELVALTRSTYPSLADTDKPEPPSDWS